MARRRSSGIAAVRAFNRFYPLKVGLLSPVISTVPSRSPRRELSTRSRRAAKAEVADLRRELGLDAGYLSRMLNRFEEEGVIARGRSRAIAVASWSS